MKTSLAHLEFENAQMKRDVAKLRRENREMEDRLVQQEQDNGELAARLDDARNLMRDRGLDPTERAASNNRDSSMDSPGDGGGVRTLPAGQSNRKRRRAPFARIPGQFTPATPGSQNVDEEGLGPPQPAGAGSDADTPGLRIDDDLDHHTSYNGPLRWTPIAGTTGDPASRVR